MTPPAPHPAPGSGRTLALDEFPKELIEEILGYLDLGDQQALRRVGTVSSLTPLWLAENANGMQTSRRFKEVYDASPTLQYALELERCGFRPLKPGAATQAEAYAQIEVLHQLGDENEENDGKDAEAGRVFVSQTHPHIRVEISRTATGFANCPDTPVTPSATSVQSRRACFKSREERWRTLTPAATRAITVTADLVLETVEIQHGRLVGSGLVSCSGEF